MNSSADDRRLLHFRSLTREQQEQAIRRLAATGLSDRDIATATGLAVDQVRSAIGNAAQLQRLKQ